MDTIFIMHPMLFGVVDSWLFFVILGVSVALIGYRILSVRFKLSDSAFSTFGMIAIASILIGFLFAWLFQGFYNFRAKGEWGLLYKTDEGKWMMGGLTFMGGLVGGAVAFIVLTLIFVKGNMKNQLWNMICLAPPLVSIAHSLGRIGCFLGGCCYGKHTDSFLAMDFGVHTDRLPTQLFESIFLAILAVVLLVIVIKYKKYGLSPIVYLYSYAVFRFLIEFLRGDYRGGASFISPSQWQSVFMLLLAVLLTVCLGGNYVPFNGKVDNPFCFIYDGLSGDKADMNAMSGDKADINGLSGDSKTNINAMSGDSKTNINGLSGDSKTNINAMGDDSKTDKNENKLDGLNSDKDELNTQEKV